MTYIADLHCHPSFKPYNNKGYRNNTNGQPFTLWENIPEVPEHYDSLPKEIKPIIAESARESQSNLDTLAAGDVRGIFFVIHPIERGWLFRRKKSPNPLRRWLLAKVLKPEDVAHLGAGLAGIPYDKVVQLIDRVAQNKPIDYYEEETYPEYQFIKAGEQTVGANGQQLKLVSNYAEYRDIIANHPDTLAGVITLEGGHSLNYVPRFKVLFKEYHQLNTSDLQKVRTHYLENIKNIKGVGSKPFDVAHTPFFITLVHMYNNFLAGHAKSYHEGVGIQPGMEDLLDQETALNDSITPLGYEVIDKLLRKSSEEKRVLIDVKHMSLAARKDYYRLVKGRRENGDTIPIIYSHGAVNGLSWNEFRGEDSTPLDKNSWFSQWSINLYDEDIKEIYDSDGIIGIDPHEGRMPGGEALELFRQLKRRVAWGDHNQHTYEGVLRKEYVKLIVGNIFQIVSVIRKKKAWDIIALGSDYDGIMNPFDSYPKGSDFRSLLNDIQAFLTNPEELIYYRASRRDSLSPGKVRQLMYGYTPQEIVDKIASKNTEVFLSKYFTDECRLEIDEP